MNGQQLADTAGRTGGAQWWGDMAFAAIAGDVRPATFDAPRENLWRGDATD